MREDDVISGPGVPQRPSRRLVLLTGLKKTTMRPFVQQSYFSKLSG